MTSDLFSGSVFTPIEEECVSVVYASFSALAAPRVTHIHGHTHSRASQTHKHVSLFNRTRTEIITH